ncbi:hypothetical protein ACEPAH_9115 [Sanghuangporus vaninii]
MTSAHNYYPMSVADMRDVYGLMDNISAPSSTRSSRVSSTPKSQRSSSSSFSFSRMLRKKGRVDASDAPVSAPTPTPSNSRRPSLDSQRTLTTPPTVVTSPKPMQAPRDYEAAFGALSSSYGFSGSGPTFVPVVPTAPSTRTSSRKVSNSQSPPPQMDEQTARLGNLLSQYGTSSAPTVGGFRR